MSYNKDQYSEALQLFDETLICYREAGDRRGEGMALTIIGAVYHGQGRNDEALNTYQQALEIMREVGERAWEGTVLNNLGGVYHSQGHYEKALVHYQEALGISREVGNRAGEGSTLNNIGLVYYLQANYEQALVHYQQALEISREVGNRKSEGATLGRKSESATLGNLALVYYRQGNYNEALAHLQQELEIDREVGDRAGEGITLNQFGMVYSGLGRYDEALAHHQQALEITREVGNRAGEGTALANLGALYIEQGRYDKALAHLQQALEIKREVGERADEGSILNILAGLYHKQERYDEALKYYRQALEIRREVGNRAGEGLTLNNLGSVYISRERYDEALAHLQQALEIIREVGDHADEGSILNNVGWIYNDQERYEEALDYYRQALEIHREVGNRTGEGTTLSSLGVFYEGQGRYEEALAHFQQAVEVIEEIRGNIKIEELKSSFSSEQVPLYERTIDLLIQLELHDKAFSYVQRSKARTFLDQMGNVRINPKATDKPELIEREQELLGEIRALEEVLFGRRDFKSLSFDETTRSGPPELTDEQRQEVLARLQAKRKEYEQLLIEIKTTNPEYASLVTVDTLTLTETQQLLPNGTTLVEYYVLPEETLAFIVTADSFHTEAISVTQEMLLDEINQFYWRPQTTSEGIPSSVQTLYDWLVAPLEGHLENEELIIAPHGILHYMPFAALHDGEQYLIEEYTLTELSSASILPFVQAKRKENVAPLLILGDADGSLPYARQEAEAIAARYDSVAYVGNQAQEQLVWEQGHQAGIVHLSTHGIYNPLAPAFSRVLLAPDAQKQYDGFLELHEVYNLDLQQADLVVLSACQTNLGEQSRGDEIIGLNRAFIYAGTPSVMATLWSVDDNATKDLMVAFYSYLDEGYSKGEALRQAQIDALQNPDKADPYFWAGFVLTGDSGVSKVQSSEKIEETEKTEGTEKTEKAGIELRWIMVLVVVGGMGCVGGGAYVYGKRRRTE